MRSGRRRVPPGTVPPVGQDGRQKRTNWDVHREQMRRASAARKVAVNQLIAEHPEEFAAFYRMFGMYEDPVVIPEGSEDRDLDADRDRWTRALLREVERLEQRLEELRMDEISGLRRRLDELECEEGDSDG